MLLDATSQPLLLDAASPPENNWARSASHSFPFSESSQVWVFDFKTLPADPFCAACKLFTSTCIAETFPPRRAFSTPSRTKSGKSVGWPLFLRLRTKSRT
jgi:hypothetical protein